MPNVLFVNHRSRACGVQQFGKRLYDALATSVNYACYYIDIDRQDEFDFWAGELNPALVVYNYYTSATMPWLSTALLQRQRGRFKQVSIFHEVPIEYMGFDLLLHQDPTIQENELYVPLARPIPRFDSYERHSTGRPVISSFGFGLGGKGFDRIVRIAAEHTPDAIVRLNIPYAKFGDENGNGARAWADLSRQANNTNLELRISHDMLDERDLLNWLSESDVNCFFYDDNYGRGISGTLDYALAVKRPIAITRSYQFKHVWGIDDSFLIEHTTLPEIIARGTDHLEKFHTLWGDAALVQSFEHAFRRLGV